MAIIQSAIASGNAAAVPVTFAIDNVLGNSIIVFTQFNAVADAKTITDTQGNSYAPLHAVTGSGFGLQPFIAQNIKAGPNTVSIHSAGGGDFMILGVIEDDAIANSPLDQFTSNAGSTTAMDSGTTGATTNAIDLIVAWGGNESNTATFTAGAGYAIVRQVGDAVSGQAMAVESKEVIATGTQDATMTQSAALSWEMAIVALKRTVSTFSISGNAGIAGATVALTGDATSSTTSAGDGSYTFIGLSAGNYVVTPSLTGYTFAPTSRSETITSSNITGVDFVATKNPSGGSNAPNVTGTITFGARIITAKTAIMGTGQRTQIIG